MYKIKKNRIIAMLCLMSALAVTNVLAQADHSFNYQGELLDGGTPANGEYDIIVQMVDGLGTEVGTESVHEDTQVTNGLFNINVTIGGISAFDGFDNYFFSIRVRHGNSGGLYTFLSPDQALQAVPLATNLVNGDAVTGEVLTFNGFQWAPSLPASTSPWTVVGTTVSYNGSAELTGTASVNSSNGGLSVGSTSGSHMTIDGDDIQRRINGSNDPGTMYLNFYGGDVRIGSSTNEAVIRGDLKQPIDQNGVMKYMVHVFCTSPTASILKSFNGVNTSAITVTNSPGGCIIDFPTNINDRFFQASPVFATSGNSTSSRAVQCRIGAANNQLLCNFFRPSTGARDLGSFMVLIY